MKRSFFGTPPFLLGLVMVLSLGLAACGGDSHAHDEQGGPPAEQTSPAMEAPHGEGPEYTSAYVCPMHCEGSGSEEPGKCPVCGMDYVANEDHIEDGHHHDHEDHMQGGHHQD